MLNIKIYTYYLEGILNSIPSLFFIYIINTFLIMLSCIVTIIKNEHEYLDEWIKYHLNLGINHIFIFEDIDSKSHKVICDKYKNMVTLNNIRHVIIDKEDKKLADKLKLTKKWNVQHVYFKCILKHLY